MVTKYNGMTVNERLFISGCMKKFDKLVNKKDINGIIKTLKKIEITDEESISEVLICLGLNNNKK